MSEKNTGGPAYPTISNVENKQDWITEEGMTLRDYFAGQALTLVWDAMDKGYSGFIDKDDVSSDEIARGAYQLADAMIKERNK